jgi:transcriptional regulator with XRE-family HTH domain
MSATGGKRTFPPAFEAPLSLAVTARSLKYCFKVIFGVNESNFTRMGAVTMDRAARVGANIKRFRELAELSKSELARRVGVSPTAVNNWEENGVIPRMEIMLKLEKVLEVSWMQLQGGFARDASAGESKMAAASDSLPETSRNDRLSQFRRQIATLFDVTPDRVEIVIRT